MSNGKPYSNRVYGLGNDVANMRTEFTRVSDAMFSVSGADLDINAMRNDEKLYIAASTVNPPQDPKTVAWIEVPDFKTGATFTLPLEVRGKEEVVDCQVGELIESDLYELYLSGTSLAKKHPDAAVGVLIPR